MSTWRGIIKSSLMELGVIRVGGQVHTHQLDEALVRLKMMLSSWNLDELLQFGVIKTRYTADVQKKEFELGADLGITDIPDRISLIRYYRNGDYEPYTMARVSLDNWAHKEYKDREYPSLYYYNNDRPEATLYFDADMGVGDYFDFYGRKQIPSAEIQFDDDIEFPNGYERAILCNLAVELSSSYGISSRDIGASTVRNASQGLKMIRSRNISPPRSRFTDLVRMSGGVFGGSSMRNR